MDGDGHLGRYARTEIIAETRHHCMFPIGAGAPALRQSWTGRSTGARLTRPRAGVGTGLGRAPVRRCLEEAGAAGCC
jgi:hypothetical protein